MKRILFVHQSSAIGGGSYCLLNILKTLDRSVVEPLVCLANDGPLRCEIENLGIGVIYFKQMAAVPYNRPLWFISSIRAYQHVRKSINAFKILLIENNIDIVYLNNMMIYGYLKPAKDCGCKTILHCREHWPLDEHKIQLMWARNAVYHYADELVAINQYSASIFPDKKSTIVYDWIDMDSRYEERPMTDLLGEDSNGKKVYLYTGGVQRIKGAVEVINSFSKCVRDSNARLLVVGINPSYSVSKIKQILAFVGLKSYYYRVREAILADSRIRCIPPTYMLSHIMQQSYCNLSYFTIPHANLALAECEIMGVPSIAARNPEAEEYSLGGQLSYLYKPNDIKSFNNAIVDFDNKNPEYRAELEAWASYIKEKFSQVKNSKTLNNVLNQLCK